MGKIKKKFRWKFRMWCRTLQIAYARVRWPARITDTNPFKPVWVSPSSITHRHPYHSFQHAALPSWVSLTPNNGRFCPILSAGLVVPGDWHLGVEPFNPKAGMFYKSLEDRYLRGDKWEETTFFQSAVAAVSQGRKIWNRRGCVEELLTNCAKTDRLKESIEKHGIQHTIPPFQVNIGPSGELIKNGEGTHRLLLCLLLNIESFPIHVVVRHCRWQEIRNAVRVGQTDQKYVDHPDLKTIKPPVLSG